MTPYLVQRPWRLGLDRIIVMALVTVALMAADFVKATMVMVLWPFTHHDVMRDPF
jgi:hypothetical protein